MQFKKKGTKNNMVKLISVDSAVRTKSPKMYKYLPKFLIRWVEKLIHQQEMNDMLVQHYDETPTQFAQSTLDYFHVKIEVTNEENFPKSGRYIVVSNHPLGGLDGVALIALAGRYRTDVKFPVNDLLMHLEPMRDAFIPINKFGKNSHDMAQQFDEAFSSDNLIFYFPAGLCSRRRHGTICDVDWKKTIIAKARQYKREIIPAYFEGQNSNRFYRLANIRKKLGIKFNIEMLFLPDEMFRQKGNTFRVTFGKPISYETFDNSRTDTEWAAWLKGKSYNLKQS